MKFEEIFKEKGLYKTDSFIKGYCLEVDEDGWLHSLHYRDENDLLPIRENAYINKSYFSKDFTKVFTRQSLFK